LFSGIIVEQVSSMKKLNIYLETSVLNFYFAEDAKEKMEDTRKLFAEIKDERYSAYVSMSVIREISKASEEQKTRLFGIINEYEVDILDDQAEAERIAEIYVQEGIIPARFIADGLHIALATVHNMDMIIS
jgi:hypothetical protein